MLVELRTVVVAAAVVARRAACLVCAVAMKDGTVKHVCKDGPVFNAEEVDWDA